MFQASSPAVKLRASSFKLQVRGFTLVELLITISIIGILASITVVSVGNVRQIARDSKRLADIKQLMNALEFYFNQTNGYPLPQTPNNTITLGDPAHTILCGVPQGFVNDISVCSDAGKPVIMARVPKNPIPPEREYVYTAVADPLNNGQPSLYQVTFQLETDFAGYIHGVDYVATPSGVRKK